MRKARLISAKKRKHLKINTAMQSLSGNLVYLTKDVKRIRSILKPYRYATMYGCGARKLTTTYKES